MCSENFMMLVLVQCTSIAQCIIAYVGVHVDIYRQIYLANMLQFTLLSLDQQTRAWNYIDFLVESMSSFLDIQLGNTVCQTITHQILFSTFLVSVCSISRWANLYFVANLFVLKSPKIVSLVATTTVLGSKQLPPGINCRHACIKNLLNLLSFNRF